MHTHTFIQNMSDLSEHVWKAAGLQHANATDLPLCKSSSLQTSTLPWAWGFHINVVDIIWIVSISMFGKLQDYNMLMPPTSPCANRAARKHQCCPHALHAVFQSELDIFIHLLTPTLGPPCAAKPNPSSAFHLSNLLSCSVMSIGQASAGMLKLSQPELKLPH